jgi:hypothetical protein
MSNYRDQPRSYNEAFTRLLAGSKFYFFESGTDNKKDAYAEMAVVAPLDESGASTTELSAPHPNPLIADSAGRLPAIYLSGTYRLVVNDASGNEIYDIDPFVFPYVIPGPEVVTSVSNSNRRLPFSTLTFYKSNTTILEDEGYDNPMVADENGEFTNALLDDNKAYRVILKDGSGQLIYDIDPYFVLEEEVEVAAKIAGGKFDNSTGALISGYNIQSGERTSEGNYLVTFTPGYFSSVPVCVPNLSFGFAPVANVVALNETADSVEILVSDADGNPLDGSFVLVCVTP